MFCGKTPSVSLEREEIVDARDDDAQHRPVEPQHRPARIAGLNRRRQADARPGRVGDGQGRDIAARHRQALAGGDDRAEKGIAQRHDRLAEARPGLGPER
jgi:hypothetical protein